VKGIPKKWKDPIFQLSEWRMVRRRFWVLVRFVLSKNEEGYLKFKKSLLNFKTDLCRSGWLDESNDEMFASA